MFWNLLSHCPAPLSMPEHVGTCHLLGRCLASKVHLGRVSTETFQKLGLLSSEPQAKVLSGHWANGFRADSIYFERRRGDHIPGSDFCRVNELSSGTGPVRHSGHMHVVWKQPVNSMHRMFGLLVGVGGRG